MFANDKAQRRALPVLDLQTNRIRRIQFDRAPPKGRRFHPPEIAQEQLHEDQFLELLIGPRNGELRRSELKPVLPEGLTWIVQRSGRDACCDLCGSLTEWHTVTSNPVICTRQRLKPTEFNQRLRERANAEADKRIERFRRIRVGAEGPYGMRWVCDICDIHAPYEFVKSKKNIDGKFDVDAYVKDLDTAIERQIREDTLLEFLAKEGDILGMNFLTGIPKPKRKKRPHTSHEASQLKGDSSEKQQNEEHQDDLFTDGLTTPSMSFCEKHNPRRSSEARKLYQKDCRIQDELEDETARLLSEHFGTYRPWSIDDYGEIRQRAYDSIHARNPRKTTIKKIRELEAQGIYRRRDIALKLGISRWAVYKSVAKSEGRFPAKRKRQPELSEKE